MNIDSWKSEAKSVIPYYAWCIHFCNSVDQNFYEVCKMVNDLHKF